MREDRAASVDFCGGDELVLPPAEAKDRLNACHRHRQDAAVAGQPSRTRSRRLPGPDLPFFELLRKPGFTWREHGEALLRRSKPWYYANEPRPGVSVIGDRLSSLAADRR
jgi:hypothetical protein